MKERPILLSAPMARAILEGRKTQTRRVVKRAHIITTDDRTGATDDKCPYGVPGDRLWVKETFNIGRVAPIYKADNPDGLPPSECTDDWNRPDVDRWRPSIHMPRWACRITLEVVSVRVERLQEISEADAEAEGCDPALPVADKRWVCGYRRLWESINGPGSWAANPWVWVLEFQRVSAGGAA